ncbi:MAG: ATP-binding cassette domain-containing protein [Phycisphaerales bacterium]|nr:ATP-binding cassette domain-containing protein [Phycisphaerales bacterium]
MPTRPTSRKSARAAKPAAERKTRDSAPAPVDSPNVSWLTVRGARHNNLRDVDVSFPLARFTCVTGVSGSGKSSLVNDILHNALATVLNRANAPAGAHDSIEGVDRLDRVIAIDQSPIGRTPRSNPGTYIKVFDEIRSLFTKLPDAKLRGYKAGRFSFNVPSGPKGGGRCEACEGNGSNRVEMDFLADVWVTCPICEGHRFSRETLQIQYKGKSIADVLEMDVQDALLHFENVPRIRHMLQTLHDVGLDYIKLGQPSTTLSGGEAQRIKLARELVKKSTERTLYILDEPTTGLHFEDIRRLLDVLHGFVDGGATVVVIEHNLDVIRTADWLIDLGPEGGAGGGYVIAEGTPEDVAGVEASHTGAALREEMARASGTGARRAPKRAKAAASSANGESRDIVVRGARQHNLKDVSTRIPRDQITVCTGVSGSGKTSFAIDTVYTEGYRRYVESLSAYARQFLGQVAKPRVDHIEGLSPAICIEQKAASKSPRSTVGTITEVYDYMRVLWSRLGVPHCVNCDLPVGSQTVDEITDRVMALEAGSPIMLLAPVKLGDGETWTALITRLRNSGYARVRIDGQIVRTDEGVTIDPRRRRRVEIVVDRTVVKPRSRGRIAESIEHALSLGDGVMILLVEAFETVSDEGTEHRPEREQRFSQRLACHKCGSSYEELTPHHFSFNSQMGWCETCEGLGVQRGAPAHSVIADARKTLFNGAIQGWPNIDRRSKLGRMLNALCAHLQVDPAAPLAEWTHAQMRSLMYGSGREWIDGADAFAGVRFRWRGFFPTIDSATRNSWWLRRKLHDVLTDMPCVTCQGGRLRPEPAAARFAERRITEVCDMTLGETLAFFDELKLGAEQRPVGGELLHEIRARLKFLVDVGLDYLTLHRGAPTLSGGEAQRIRLASQIGSGLSGVLYVLDEPTIGLHPRDTARLTGALARLRDLGNTLLLVEHDRDVIRGADRLLDFGPQAGRGGGEIVNEGAPDALAKGRSNDERSLTAQYLSGALAVEVPDNSRPVDRAGMDKALAERGEAKRGARVRKKRPTSSEPRGPDHPATDWLVLRGVRQNNLKNLDVAFPLGRLVCVTGPSGSGKSSLVNDVLWPALANGLNRAGQTVGDHDGVDGMEYLDKAVNVDQSPLGATPASNPATYTGVFDWIREVLARTPDAKVRGYEAKRFSFNRPGGRCEQCEGQGQVRIEMHFMPDVWVNCETCDGKRYNPETLDIRFRGKNIADVLEMSIGEARRLFENVPKVRRMLDMLCDVGLEYVPLGQSATTLSGGEAQRVRLAAELGRPDTGRTLFLLDEPTTGLHFDDVRKLLEVLHRLVDLGNTVVAVEHNLDVIKSADWVIDLGPEAGAGGGEIVAIGQPADIASCAASHTGVALQPVIEAGPFITRDRCDAAAYAARQLEDEKKRLGDIGKDVQMPWQVDGKKWHLRQRSGRGGQTRQWEPAALEFVLDLVQDAGDFEPTDWSNRASVEVTAKAAPTWFLHALTGGEWLLELYFRAPPGAFDAEQLDRKLKLKTLDQRTDLETYGDWPRVDVRPRRDGLDAIVVYVYDREEIDTPAFRDFIKRASRAYLSAMAAASSNA